MRSHSARDRRAGALSRIDGRVAGQFDRIVRRAHVSVSAGTVTWTMPRIAASPVGTSCAVGEPASTRSASRSARSRRSSAAASATSAPAAALRSLQSSARPRGPGVDHLEPLAHRGVTHLVRQLRQPIERTVRQHRGQNGDQLAHAVVEVEHPHPARRSARDRDVLARTRTRSAPPATGRPDEASRTRSRRTEDRCLERGSRPRVRQMTPASTITLACARLIRLAASASNVTGIAR